MLVTMVLTLSGCTLLFQAEEGQGFTPSNGVQLPKAGELSPLGLTNGQFLALGSAQDTTFVFFCREDGDCESVPANSLRLAIVNDDSPQGGYLLAEMESLNIDQSSALVGTGPLPLVVAVATDITIEGQISVASFYDDDPEADEPFFLGAGGYLGGEGGLPGTAPAACSDAMNSPCQAALFISSGQGGAHAQLGGTAAGGARGGQIYGGARLIPLIGGGGGGGGGANGDLRARGGDGGGALQISAGRSISLSGRISAAGGGGRAAESTDLPSIGGGGGGGAGGAILLEAPDVNLFGQVTVQGGPGASGNCPSSSARGSDGGDELIAEAPGDCTGDGGAGGGTGGQDGQVGAPNGGNGGGGGGHGRIRVNFGDYAVDHPPFIGLAPPTAVSTGPLGK